MLSPLSAARRFERGAMQRASRVRLTASGAERGGGKSKGPDTLRSILRAHWRILIIGEDRVQARRSQLRLRHVATFAASAFQRELIYKPRKPTPTVRTENAEKTRGNAFLRLHVCFVCSFVSAGKRFFSTRRVAEERPCDSSVRSFRVIVTTRETEKAQLLYSVSLGRIQP